MPSAPVRCWASCALPLLLTDPKEMDSEIAKWIGARTRQLVVFGGPAAVSANALSAVSDDAALDGLLAQQAISRARFVRELAPGIEAGMYGVGADRVLRGPGAFEIDLSACPSRWSDTGGITADEIRVGHTTSLTGDLSVNRYATEGFKSYVNWVNENDPITIDGTPRELALLITDDRSFEPDQAVAAVERFLESGNVFSILTLGTLNTFVTYDRINDGCVPQPFVMSNHPAAADPERHPWTTGTDMSYATEARLWGEWMRHNLAEELPVHVAALVADSYLGQTWEHAFAEWADEHPEVVSKFTPRRHASDGSNLAGQVAAVARSEPDVLLALTWTEGCARTIAEVEAAGLNESLDAAFMTQVCAPAAQYLAPAGAAADGWWIVSGGAKSYEDPVYAEEPLMKLLRASMHSGGPSQSQGLFAAGFRYGYTYVEALRIAAALPGGLTRTNFILAVRTLDIDHPLYLDGVSARMRGLADASFIEGSRFGQYDASAREIVQVGDVLDIDGQTPNCQWDYRAWLSGRRPIGWDADVSNPFPGGLRRFQVRWESRGRTPLSTGPPTLSRIKARGARACQ